MTTKLKSISSVCSAYGQAHIFYDADNNEYCVFTHKPDGALDAIEVRSNIQDATQLAGNYVGMYEHTPRVSK